MNLTNVVITRVTQPIPDWNIKADITDDAGNVVSTFGVDGTSVNDWWNSQSEEFQLEYVGIFMSVMAVQIAGTD
jgi:hypothetical protein